MSLAPVAVWTRYRFLMQASSAFHGRTPLEALRAGEIGAALRAADAWATGEQGRR